MSDAPWCPVLEGAEADLAIAASADVARALRPGANPTLASGSAGFALLHAQLARIRPGQGHQEASRRFLGAAFETVASTTMSPSLHEGFTGVAWVEQHLAGFGAEDTGEEVDLALLDLVSRRPWRRHFDLISGLAGIGIHAVERLPRPAARECLAHVVARLAETGERLADGLAWKENPDLIPEWARPWTPRGNYNLGVAHGAPGVVALLGQACAAGIAAAGPVLADSVRWILARRDRGARGSELPGWWLPNDAPGSGRTAWCYGDIGAAGALLVAARCARNADWERDAVDLALAAARRPPEETGVVDAGLCHGAAGLGLLFHRLHYATREARFADAALAWYRRALAMREPGRWNGGFGAWDPGTREMTEDAGFLAGACGVALALLAAATPVEPTWDRVLALSSVMTLTSDG